MEIAGVRAEAARLREAVEAGEKTVASLEIDLQQQRQEAKENHEVAGKLLYSIFTSLSFISGYACLQQPLSLSLSLPP